LWAERCRVEGSRVLRLGLPGRGDHRRVEGSGCRRGFGRFRVRVFRLFVVVGRRVLSLQGDLSICSRHLSNQVLLRYHLGLVGLIVRMRVVSKSLPGQVDQLLGV
jgi:hypothetical protein